MLTQDLPQVHLLCLSFQYAKGRVSARIRGELTQRQPPPQAARWLQQWQNLGPWATLLGVLAWLGGPEKGVLWVHWSVMNT